VTVADDARGRVRSLGLRTDIDVLGDRCEVLDRGDHMVVRTPSIPTFHWGNFVVTEGAPAPGDRARWEAWFDADFDRTRSTHRTFVRLDGPEGDAGDVAPFVDAGYLAEDVVVLAVERTAPAPNFDPGLDCHPVVADEEWRAVIDLQFACRDVELGEAGYMRFLEGKFAMYRDLAAQGVLTWWGAWIDGQLVGDLGIVVRDDRARFQSVETHPTSGGAASAARSCTERRPMRSNAAALAGS
jgi:hypothetical protein